MADRRMTKELKERATKSYHEHLYVARCQRIEYARHIEAGRQCQKLAALNRPEATLSIIIDGMGCVRGEWGGDRKPRWGPGRAGGWCSYDGPNTIPPTPPSSIHRGEATTIPVFKNQPKSASSVYDLGVVATTVHGHGTRTSGLRRCPWPSWLESEPSPNTAAHPPNSFCRGGPASRHHVRREGGAEQKRQPDLHHPLACAQPGE